MAKNVSHALTEAIIQGANGNLSALDNIFEQNDNVAEFGSHYRRGCAETIVKAPYRQASVIVVKAIFPGDSELPVLPNPYSTHSLKALMWAFDVEVVDFNSAFSFHTRCYNPDEDKELLEDVVSVEPAIAVMNSTSLTIVQKGRIIVK
ncbi:MAG: hypothetical protein J6J36_01805 [Clostridia bacterium]|nr:hypothetical protein [Clostridia bacterium]